MHEVARPAVENGAPMGARPRDVEVREIDVPVLVRLRRLVEARALFRWRARPAIQTSRVLEHAIPGGGTDCDVTRVQQQVGQATIAVQGMPFVNAQNAVAFRARPPVIAGHRAVWCLHRGARAERRDAVHDLVAAIGRDPVRGHGPPYFFHVEVLFGHFRNDPILLRDRRFEHGDAGAIGADGLGLSTLGAAVLQRGRQMLERLLLPPKTCRRWKPIYTPIDTTSVGIHAAVVPGMMSPVAM